ncbi:hypothetical protein [Fischerella sp. PCC 9605]|uniref:hypothetical protein n=1 Tax=Fischerella sp. PCC 9605 TaxID=1173024 RepID=UPI0018CC2CCC|nr:hypothetical protein [Fischerella sp. PCC 9605]
MPLARVEKLGIPFTNLYAFISEILGKPHYITKLSLLERMVDSNHYSVYSAFADPNYFSVNMGR